ncbi:SMI1/KNR4 family protein [Vreelandella sp. EE7]
MAEYDELAKAVEAAGYEIFWLGSASRDQVRTLERLLSAPFPSSFKNFLEIYGGGGVVSAEISGIEDGDVENEFGGTVLFDTKECRELYNLPAHLIVIYYHDDEVCWCLDTSRYAKNECPVVSYNLFTKKIDRDIASDFGSFIEQHLLLYTQAD